MMENKTGMSTILQQIPVAQQSTRRETDMNDEFNRLWTFEAVWPVDHILPEELAQYGFYYVGSPDIVKCHFCDIQIGAWEEGDDVITDHLRWSPYCPLMRKQRTENVPLDPHFLDSVPDPEPDVTSNYGGPYEHVGSSTRHSDSVPFCDPEHPYYALESEYLRLLATQRKEETKESDDKLCKICYENGLGAALIPCGHVTCSKCALKLDKCPMCQSRIRKMQKLYL